MSQAAPKCEHSDCRNIGMTTSQCTECEKYFCDEHLKAHIAEGLYETHNNLPMNY